MLPIDQYPEVLNIQPGEFTSSARLDEWDFESQAFVPMAVGAGSLNRPSLGRLRKMGRMAYDAARFGGPILTSFLSEKIVSFPKKKRSKLNSHSNAKYMRIKPRLHSVRMKRHRSLRKYAKKRKTSKAKTRKAWKTRKARWSRHF